MNIFLPLKLFQSKDLPKCILDSTVIKGLGPSSSVNMRRLAQFVRLRASASGSVCASASACVLSRVCVRLRASACVLSHVCVRLASRVCVRLAQFVRLESACVCVWLSLCVCVCVRLSRVCLRLAQFMRLLASVCVGRLVSRVSRVYVHLFTSRVPNARVCVRRSSCLASVCVCLWELAHFMRRSSFKEFKGGGNWLRFLLSVSRHTIPLLYI